MWQAAHYPKRILFVNVCEVKLLSSVVEKLNWKSRKKLSFQNLLSNLENNKKKQCEKIVNENFWYKIDNFVGIDCLKLV